MNLTDELKKSVNWREKESFPHSCEITKPFGIIDQILVWCRSECQAEWRWELLSASTDIRPGHYRLYFDSDRDFSAFLLKWS